MRTNKGPEGLFHRRGLWERVSVWIYNVIVLTFKNVFSAPTAALQDLQLHFNVGLGQWANEVRAKGGVVSDAAKELLLDSTFATLTNVNFDSSRFLEYLKKSNAIRNSLKDQAKSLGVDSTKLSGPANFEYEVG